MTNINKKQLRCILILTFLVLVFILALSVPAYLLYDRFIPIYEAHQKAKLKAITEFTSYHGISSLTAIDFNIVTRGITIESTVEEVDVILKDAVSIGMSEINPSTGEYYKIYRYAYGDITGSGHLTVGYMNEQYVIEYDMNNHILSMEWGYTIKNEGGSDAILDFENKTLLWQN